MGTTEKIEDYLESIEEFFSSSLSAADKAINQLWLDITRYGPGMPNFPEVKLPGLGDFEVPLPPPPPPPPPTLYEKTAMWIERNPWKTAGILVGAIGAGLFVGYGSAYIRALRARRLKEAAAQRRQVVVVLGGDTPYGLPLVLGLEKKGYIVIASVSVPEAVDSLEQKCHGYVRALVLDPTMPETVQFFLRSLSSTLGRRFPITAAGDPFASPASHPYIHSVISLLTLPTSTVHGPLEHISLEDSYLSYLTATQITPLHVIQALLPLLRTVPSKGKKTIIVCLPATETRMGLPFSAIQSMSAASTLRATEVLRREIHAAALTGKSEFMKNIKVVIVDVGGFKAKTSVSRPMEDAYKTMEKWTVSEKLTYGPAFAAISQKETGSAKACHRFGVPRKPTDVSLFVDNIVDVVGNGEFGPSIFGIGLGIGRVRNWMRGERFSIGAGSYTYKYASFLPSLILDALLNIPHVLISIRNALLPIQPFARPPPPPPPPAAPPSLVAGSPGHPAPSDSEHDGSNNDVSEAGSEADVESNSGDAPSVDASWVSLKGSNNA